MDTLEKNFHENPQMDVIEKLIEVDFQGCELELDYEVHTNFLFVMGRVCEIGEKIAMFCFNFNYGVDGIGKIDFTCENNVHEVRSVILLRDKLSMMNINTSFKIYDANDYETSIDIL